MSHTDARVWLITGSSSGFGLQLAQTVVEQGDHVVATARDISTLDELVSRAPDAVLPVRLDVTDQTERAAAVAAATDHFGRLDVLVNNAGFGSVGAVEEIDFDQFRPLMETMFFAPLALTQVALPAMRAQRSGAVVQISSMGGQVTMPGFGAYCAAKFALEAVSESLATEVAPFGIQVLIVEPGAFATGFGGHRMQRSPQLDDVYEQTVGPTRAAVDAMDGSQPGDPAKAAAAIVRAVGDDAAPLHLALGGDAVDAIRAAQDGRRADVKAWEEVSRATAAQPCR